MFLLPFFFLPFFFLFLFPQKKIELKGFVRILPEPWLQEMETLSSEDLQKRLIADGRFRSVQVSEREEERTIEVVEYPLIRNVVTRGNTIHSKDWLIDFFQLREGSEYNRVVLSRKVEEFQDQVHAQGYTHLTIRRIRIDDAGETEVEISEGALLRVEVDPPVVSPSLILRFFRNCLGRPFYTPAVKEALENLLYTRAFYNVHSDVRAEGDGLVLQVKPDRKSILEMDSYTSYSHANGSNLHAEFVFVKKNGRMQFHRPVLDMVFGAGRTAGRLAWEHFDYRRQTGENHFCLNLIAAFDHKTSSSIHSADLRLRPAFFLKLADGFFFSPFVQAGFGSPRNTEEPRYFLEAGVNVAYQRQGPLNLYRISLAAEHARALGENASRSLVSAEYTRKIGDWNFRIDGFLREQQGVPGGIEFPFLEEKSGMLPFPELFTGEDLRLASVELNGPILWRFLRPGGFLQYVGVKTPFTVYGIQATLHLAGLPLQFRLYRRGIAWNVSLMIRLAVE